ncbi:HNH endonuclease [Vibrio cholerae]|nr:HNH endonuclease [Vibrio cholerae]
MYSPDDTRNDLEAVHGAENVVSTTNPKDPLQRVNSNPDKGIEVIHGDDGGKAVRVHYDDDPITGEPIFANIPYNSRGLPIFDDHAKFTTRIDKSKNYDNQFTQATRDLRDAINSGKADTSQFTDIQLKLIQSGAPKIKGLTWHHNGDTGTMQLVSESIHDAVKHIGEKSLSKGK